MCMYICCGYKFLILQIWTIFPVTNVMHLSFFLSICLFFLSFFKKKVIFLGVYKFVRSYPQTDRFRGYSNEPGFGFFVKIHLLEGSKLNL